MFHDTLVPCAERRNINMDEKGFVTLAVYHGNIKKVECKKNILILKVVELYGKMYSYIMY